MESSDVIVNEVKRKIYKLNLLKIVKKNTINLVVLRFLRINLKIKLKILNLTFKLSEFYLSTIISTVFVSYCSNIFVF